MMMLRTQGYAFSYFNKYKAPLENYYQKNELLGGWCTSEQSLSFTNRNKSVHPSHWRSPIGIQQKIMVSSLGIGTFNGEPSNEFDYQMFGALVDSIQSGGINVIDTCTLYRFGKSEKVINAVLNYLVKQKGYKREEFLVSTKCGYIPNDIDSNLNQQDFIRVLTKDNIINQDDIVNGIHYFTLEKSRLALGLETIDILYINNFSEAHLPVVGEQVTYRRLRAAFEKMEEMRSQSRIRYYGISSYVGLRSPQIEEGVHFRLQKAIKIAKEVGGDNHGFRFVMVPFSLGTPQILLKWQDYNIKGIKKQVRVFDIAQAQKINIVSCSPLFQGKVANLPFQSKLLDYLQYSSARHLQLIRSFSSPALLTTLVGMTQQQHVQQNLSLLPYSLLSETQWKNILPIPQ